MRLAITNGQIRVSGGRLIRGDVSPECCCDDEECKNNGECGCDPPDKYFDGFGCCQDGQWPKLGTNQCWEGITGTETALVKTGSCCDGKCQAGSCVVCCCEAPNTINEVPSAGACAGEAFQKPATAKDIESITVVVDWDGLSVELDSANGFAATAEEGIATFTCVQPGPYPIEVDRRQMLASAGGGLACNLWQFSGAMSLFFWTPGGVGSQVNLGFGVSECGEGWVSPFPDPGTDPSWCPNAYALPVVSLVVDGGRTELRKIRGGPGTELKRLLSWIGIRPKAKCKCNARAAEMDRREAEEPGWCERNIETIVGWLREEAEGRGLPFFDAAGRVIVRRAIARYKRGIRRDQIR